MVTFNSPPDWGELASSKTYAMAMIALGAFLAISGLFFLIFLGVNWGEITSRGLRGDFMQMITFCWASLFFGTFVILQNRKRLKRISLKEQGLGEVELETPSLERFVLVFALICLNIALGLLTNNIAYYFFGVGFILLGINEFLARTSKRYKDSVGRVSRQIIVVAVATSAVICYTFVSVNLLLAFIGFGILIAYFGFVLFTRYWKKIRIRD